MRIKKKKQAVEKIAERFHKKNQEPIKLMGS